MLDRGLQITGHPGRDPVAASAGPYAARLTWIRQRTVFSSATAALDSASTSDDRSTEWTIDAFRTTDLAFFDCSWPTKCHVRSVHSGAFTLSSCSRFSPTSRTPRAASARTSLTGKVLVIATRVTSSRDLPAA